MSVILGRLSLSQELDLASFWVIIASDAVPPEYPDTTAEPPSFQPKEKLLPPVTLV